MEARLALGGMASGPLRAAATEAALQGQSLTPETIVSAAAKAAEGSSADDDFYASAEYKRHIATVLAQR